LAESGDESIYGEGELSVQTAITIGGLAMHSIHHWMNREGPIKEAIIFPSTDVIRHHPVSSTALLRLKNDSIWMVKTVGHGWTEGKIAEFGETILALDARGNNNGNLRQTIADIFDIRVLVIWDNISFRTVSRQWGISEFVASLAASTVAGSRSGGCIESEGTLKTMLVDHLKLFHNSLDPQVRSAALNGGALNIWIYNYLIDRQHGGYRQQFSSTFPLLISTVACPAVCDKFDEALHRKVDSGAPLIKELSEAWGVGPRVIRCLIGKTMDVIGKEWEGKVPVLACILDRLPSEFFPDNDEKQWIVFNKAWDIAKKWSESGSSKYSGLICCALLRESASSWKNKSQDISQLMWNSLLIGDSIRRLRCCLEMLLKIEVENIQPIRETCADGLKNVAEDALESLLEKGRLVKAAGRFALESYALLSGKDVEFRMISALEILPLLPSAFVSSNGKRRVLSLTKLDDFRVQSQALNICLLKCPEYLTRCREGNSYIMTVIDNDSGQRVSTAEISVQKSVHSAPWEVRVVSHTGLGNAPVDQECAQAVTEMLDNCNHPDIQNFITCGQKLLSDVRHGNATWSRMKAELVELIPAMTVSLGSKVYKAAVERALSNESAAFSPAKQIDTDVDASHLSISTKFVGTN
jgi:hypothetical protein